MKCVYYAKYFLMDNTPLSSGSKLFWTIWAKLIEHFTFYVAVV